jgi:hypothetical protein
MESALGRPQRQERAAGPDRVRQGQLRGEEGAGAEVHACNRLHRSAGKSGFCYIRLLARAE